ncbi:MAG: hypothetical protein Q7I92_10185 [Humidesulfovibrio sp.]|nr:hypothetical protein [Humidesulfovibrio sp.]
MSSPTKTLMKTALVGRALERAAQKAEEVARRTGTPLVVWEKGRMVERRLDVAIGVAADVVAVVAAPAQAQAATPVCPGE